MQGAVDEAVVIHRICAATQQTLLRGAKRCGNLMRLASHMRSPRFARDDNFIVAKDVRSARPTGKKCRKKMKGKCY